MAGDESDIRLVNMIDTKQVTLLKGHDGGVDVEWQWPDGSQHTVKVPKCGISTASATEAEQRCGPPPEPACNTTTNWWDLYDDTGQEWSGEHVGGAECDQSVCPYPYGASTCMPHPFVCCDRLSRTCSVWDGKVRQGSLSLPSFRFC